jgi:mannose-6-phosphate isomerase-like protein (cupin superfamily)
MSQAKHVQPTVPPVHEPQGARIVQNRASVKLAAAETGNAFKLVEARTPPGASVPVAVRHFEEKTFYILDGLYIFRIGSETIVLGAGDLAFVPRGTPYAYRNASVHTSRLLVLTTPGGVHERLVTEIDEPVVKPTGPEYVATPGGGPRLPLGEFFRQRYPNRRATLPQTRSVRPGSSPGPVGWLQAVSPTIDHEGGAGKASGNQ